MYSNAGKVVRLTPEADEAHIVQRGQGMPRDVVPASQ